MDTWETPVWWDAWEGGERPLPPPNLTAGAAARLFGGPIASLSTHPGCRPNRERLLRGMPAALLRLTEATARYHDESPKTEVGRAREWGKCMLAAEEMLALSRAVLATLAEEETEE